MKLFLFSLLVLIGFGAQARTVYLTDANFAVIDTEMIASSLDKDIAYITLKRSLLPKDQTLFVVIASPGGETDKAKILNMFLNSQPNTELICKYCASAAGWVFEKSNHKRLVMNKTELIMHEMFYDHLTARIAQYINVKEFLKDSNEFNQIFISRMKISKTAFDKRIEDSEWHMDAAEMLKRGLADELVTIVCDPYVHVILPKTCS